MWLLKKFNILFWLKFFRLLRNSDKFVGKVFFIIGNYFVENHGWIAIITGAHLVEINYQVLNLIIKPSNYDFLQTNQKSNKLFLETYIFLKCKILDQIKTNWINRCDCEDLCQWMPSCSPGQRGEYFLVSEIIMDQKVGIMNRESGNKKFHRIFLAKYSPRLSPDPGNWII